MNFPEKVKTRSVVFLLACMLVVSSVSVYYAFSASTPTSGLTDIYIEPPLMESSYIIGFYTDPTTCYLKNGTTGEITTTGTFTVCLTAAKNALTTGGKILVRSGSYNLTAPVTYSTNGVYVEGEDQHSTIIRQDWVGGGGLFYFSGSSTWRYLGGLKKLWLIGNQAASSTSVYIGTNCSDITIEDCILSSFDYGLQISAFGISGQTKVWNVWIHRCLIEDNLRYGIFLANTTDGTQRMIDRVKISECHFYNNLNSIFCDTNYIWHITFTDNTVQAERGASINVTGGRQWIISDNHIFDCGIGANGTMAAIFVNGTGTFYPDSWLIENNIIANHFTSAPVALNNSVWLTGTVRNFAIQNNYFYVASEGVRLSGLVLTSDPLLVIKDNVGNYNNTVTSWNMGFGAEPKSASYVIFKDSSYYYMMNGTTAKIDYESTNFTKVWNFAGANATTAGGKIFVKSGFYDQGEAYLYLYSNVTYQGEGPSTQINASDGTFLGGAYSGVIRNFNGGGSSPTVLDENITISDLRITGSCTGQVAKSAALELHHAKGCLIQNVWVEDFNNSNGNWGILLNGNGNGVITSYNQIDHCTFKYISYDAIHMKDDGTTDGIYGNGCQYNTASYNTISFCQIGVVSYGADFCTFSYNTISNMTYATSGASAGAFWIHDGVGNKILGNTGIFCKYAVGYADISRGTTGPTLIAENYFKPLKVGSFGGGIGNTYNLTVVDNVIDMTALNADGNYAISLNTNGVAEHNTIYGKSVSGGFIRADGSNCTIKDNIINCYDTGDYSIQLGADADFATVSGNKILQGKGISIASGCVGAKVEFNELNTVASTISNGGTSTLIRWNVNYKTEGSASSNNATTTTWTFTMNNATTVLRAYISFNSTIADPYWSATGNTLTVSTGTIIAANHTACYVEWFCWNYP